MQMQSGVCPRRPLLSRQLSLHQNVGLPAAPPLRRQLSEEHRRPTRPRQAWAMSSERRSSATPSAPGAVELVAKKVERPAILQHPNHQHPPQQQLVAALATRQELAERLRRAWREGQSKQGLNIFLTRAANEEKTEEVTGNKQTDDVDIVSSEVQPTKERLEIILAPSAPNSPPQTKESSLAPAPVRALSAGAKRVNFRNSKTTSSSFTSTIPVIKNKPLRVKSARRRPRRQDSSEEETQEDAAMKKPQGRRGVPAQSEIITQISLMSSSESDYEENTSTVPSIESPKTFLQQQQPLHMCLRKSQKTVSFQKHEQCESTYEETTPVMKSETPPVLPRPQSSILNRRKAVLERQSSAPANINSSEKDPQSTPNSHIAKEADQNLSPNSSTISMAADGTEQPENLRSPKERECWLLYRRMVDKGIAVTFDTILRGMLTPTEYRQRRAACRPQSKKCLEETSSLIEGLKGLNTK